ncbi:MAG: hypothetical protein ACPG49_07990 [Chitinophagales bacterium]
MKNKTLFLLSLILCTSLSFAQPSAILDQEHISEFEQKALEKARDFGQYIKVIGDKNSNISDASDAIDLAIALFYDENKIVQVSSLNNTEIVNFAIERYLKRLQLLKYDKVDIEWYDVHKISDIRLGDDGKYYGVITVYQRFTGHLVDGIAYSDVTEKNIEIILEKITKTIGGTTQDVWDVFLGDIKVMETS